MQEELAKDFHDLQIRYDLLWDQANSLTAENARLRRQVERLVPLVRYAMAESIAGVVEVLQEAGLCKRGVDATEFGTTELGRRIARESESIQVKLDAILADEPGEGAE